MKPSATISPIVEQIKEYIETNIQLLKLQGIEKTSSIIAEVITDLVMVMLMLLAFVFFSVTLALFTAHLLRSNWEGFGCVAVLYLLIASIVRLLRTNLQNIFIRGFIKKIFRKV